MQILLPISKSIANRLLMCKAMRGDDLSEVVASPAFASYPDDVRLLAEHLCTLQQLVASSSLAPLGAQLADRESEAHLHAHAIVPDRDKNKERERRKGAVLNCQNAGTVIRFLTAYCARLEGCEVTLTGCERMQQRPIGQLVDSLRLLGADITYLAKEGYPPLRIIGRPLKKATVRLRRPQSTQFISAFLLAGLSIETEANSPYINLTRAVIDDFNAGKLDSLDDVERDWSSAAFWLEREALGLAKEPFEFPGLRSDSLQGDRVAVELFRQIRERSLKAWDFSSCPDLYPAAAVACHLLGLHPEFTGLESLRHKESDRIAAIEDNLRRLTSPLPLNPHSLRTIHWMVLHPTGARGTVDGLLENSSSTTTSPSPVGGGVGEEGFLSFSDHRIAMAFLAAGIPVDDTACISKSYPAFLSQLLRTTRVVALREGAEAPSFNDGLITLIQPDEGLGKKHALLAAIPAVDAEYVWLTDADILPPPMPASLPDADLVILPLGMRANGPRPRFIERLQILEYDAIQALTMLTAGWGRPVMCAGANMIVRRSAWLECAEDIRPDIPSGDDMFILEAMKRRGKTVVAGDPSLKATCFAQPTLRALLRQRMRWAGKAPAYRDHDIILMGLITVLSNLLVIVCPPWALVKWLTDMALVRRYRKHRMSLGEWLLGLLLTLLYPLYMFVCLIGGLFRKRKW